MSHTNTLYMSTIDFVFMIKVDILQYTRPYIEIGEAKIQISFVI